MFFGVGCVGRQTPTKARALTDAGVYTSPALDLDLTRGVLDPRITFTRAAGPATYFNSVGVLTTAGTDVPRFDYDPVTLALRGLLIEEARINLLLNSASLGTQTVTVAAVANTLSFYGTGTVTLSGVSTAGPLVGTGANNRVSLTFTPTAGSLVCTVTGTVTNANLEAGAFATSYITTTGATATRAADVATMPVGPWFNATQGTLAVDLIFPQVLSSGSNIEIATLDAGSGADTMELRQAGAATTAQVQAFVTSVNRGGPFTANSFLANVVSKVIMNYNYVSGAITLALNGGAVGSATPTALPTPITRLNLGQGRNTPLNGYLRRVRYWPRALSDVELQAATL